MMRILIYYFAFGIAHMLLSVLTAMFFLTWGTERNAIERVFVQFIGGPFDWSKSLWFLPINSFVWATIFYILLKGGASIVRKLRA